MVASYNVLRHVAFADRFVAPDEAHALDLEAIAVGEHATSKRPSGTIEDEAAQIADVPLRERTFSAALAMANADGRCSEEEKRVLDALARVFGFASPEIVCGRAYRSTAALVAAKNAAADRMLHKMAAAMRDGAMTQERYDELVAEMQAEMARAVS
jgi:hypothetical protein